VHRDYPLSWGNYFSFPSYTQFNEIRAVNIWAENMKRLVEIGVLDDGHIVGYLFNEDKKSWFVVCDDRISNEWLYNKFCWTGYSIPKNIEIATEMFSIHGDTDNELEQITDPKSYHAKRGGEYVKTENGFFVKYPLNPK
jgi:hypothetical protein